MNFSSTVIRWLGMENGTRNYFQLGINKETDTLNSWKAKAGSLYSREFVTKPLRRARGAVREGGILEAVC